MTAKWITADVFDGLCTLDDNSVDLVVTSPPFLALRSYLPADHPDKPKEIGSEATPAEWLDTMLAVYAELRRVVAPHGSVVFEVGDTYAGSGGAGGDYDEDGLRAGQARFQGSAQAHALGRSATRTGDPNRSLPGRSLTPIPTKGDGWPLAKSKALIPQLLEIALAYGFNPLTGQESPAGKWRIRNVVTWARPNPPVGALGDKWRPATSDVIVACTSAKRYWDDLATRRESDSTGGSTGRRLLPGDERKFTLGPMENTGSHPAGAPLLDYWEIPPGGYKGAHYAVYPDALVVPLVKAMCPEKVCRTCGEPSRRIVSSVRIGKDGRIIEGDFMPGDRNYGINHKDAVIKDFSHTETQDQGFTDCGHDNYRPGLVLDPFAGSGTTLAVAHGHGHDTIGIDLDERNAELARERVGPFFFDRVEI